MSRIGHNTMSHIITVLILFAMIVCFSLVSEPSSKTSSAAETMGELIEAVNLFLDKAGEPALLVNTVDSRSSYLRTDFLRWFALFGIISGGTALYILNTGAFSKDDPENNTYPILIKLRI